MTSPIKPSVKSEVLPVLIIVAMIILSIYWYPQLPERIASHWNFQGQVNGYSSKLFMAWFIPLLTVGIYALFLALPHLDPKKNNYTRFSSAYHLLKVSLIALFFILFLVTNLYNLGYQLPVGLIISCAVGLLMIIIGLIMPRIEPNWFMGIRTPWTLSSETVWKKTHTVGGTMFILFGLCLMASTFLSAQAAAIVLIIGIFGLVGVTFIYSYILYRREHR